MSTVVNDRDAILLAAATRIVNPKNADILLQQSAPGFHVNAAGAADVVSITVSATLVGLEGAVSWSVQGATLTNVTDREATVTYANMQGSTAIVSASIMSSGERFAKSVVLATIQDGAPGSSAKTVKLTPSEQVFKVSKTGTNSPASITLTATGQNTAGTPSFTIPVGTATLTAGSSSAQKVLTFANMTTDQVTIEVTLDGQKDRVTIYKVREGQDGQPGADAVVGLLTNETVTLPAGSNGVVSSFSGAACTMKVYRGAADDSANWAYAFAPASTANSLSYTTTGGTLTVTGMAAGVDSAYVDITATKTGAAAVTKRFTVTKSKAGASVTGARGAGQHYVVGSAWSDVAAQAACPGGPVVNDQVTISNGTVTYTKRWDGAAWNVPGAYLSDDLFVEKGIRASKIDTNGLVVRAPDGTVLLDMGGLRNGYEAPGTKNSDLDPKFASLDTAYLRWDFNGSVEGWTPGLADLSADAEGMIWTPTGMNASINRGFSTAERFKGSDYPKIRARIKRISGTGTWEGRLYHSTLNGHGTSVNYFAQIKTAPANLDDGTILEWDMSKLEQGGTDWLDSTITALRIDLISDFTTAPATSFKFDWIAIGKFNTGVSPAQVDAAAELARVTAQAYADGKVSSEEARAIADATAKAEAARVAATVTTDAGTGTTTFGQRERNDAPSEYPVGISRQFKRATSIGLTGNNGIDTNAFCTLETIKQFRDATGGGVYQYAYWGIKTFRRSAPSGTGAATTWTAWVQDLDRNAYTGDLDASKGAPTGTMVGGTDAGLVASRALNGDSAYNALPGINTAIADKLSRSSPSQLASSVTLVTGGSLLAGTPTNGVYLAPDGLYCVQGGQVKVVIPISGDPTFAGKLTAAFGTLGSLHMAAGGAIHGGAFNSWAEWLAGGGSGFFFDSNVLALGDYAAGKYIILYADGRCFMPGFRVEAGQLTLDKPIIVNPRVSQPIYDTFAYNALGGGFVSGPNGSLSNSVTLQITGNNGPHKIAWSYVRLVGGAPAAPSWAEGSGDTFGVGATASNTTLSFKVSAVITGTDGRTLNYSDIFTLQFGTI